MTTLHLSQDPDADALLSRDPLALLLGMLLGQRMLSRRASETAPGAGRR